MRAAGPTGSWIEYLRRLGITKGCYYFATRPINAQSFGVLHEFEDGDSEERRLRSDELADHCDIPTVDRRLDKHA
jgi:hypothetical protein